MGVLRKRSLTKKKKKAPAVDFGAALARAREETDHIFKQACQDEIQNFSTSGSARFIGSPPAAVSPNELQAASPRSKAAAWAWYQRSNSTGVSPEEVRNRALVVVKRSSRFKAEALRVNGSYTAEDTIIKAEQRWDPNKSLFDSFELLCVAKELDKALEQQHGLDDAQAPPPFPGAKPFSKPPKDAPKSHLVSLSCSSPSLLKRASTARLTRFIPAPILCISEEDIATSKAPLSKTSSGISTTSGSSNNSSSKKMLSRGSSLGSSTFSRISKVIHLLNNNPPNTKLQPPEEYGGDDGDESSLQHHQHEHFHHHHHHHHHHLVN